VDGNVKFAIVLLFNSAMGLEQVQAKEVLAFFQLQLAMQALEAFTPP
jgi:hypothetical protein